jgi:CheY-like chemotaxis protein
MNSALAGRRVLLVEDEMIVAWLLEDMLAELGCVVLGPAARIDQAVSIINVEPLDAAVLDVNLNGQNSYPVADALVARGVPFAFSTGYAGGRLGEGYRSFAVLQKPYQSVELADTLQRLLEPEEKTQSPDGRLQDGIPD